MVLTIIRIEWEVGNIIQDHWGHCVNEMADLCMSMIDPERERGRERERERDVPVSSLSNVYFILISNYHNKMQIYT